MPQPAPTPARPAARAWVTPTEREARAGITPGILAERLAQARRMRPEDYRHGLTLAVVHQRMRALGIDVDGHTARRNREIATATEASQRTAAERARRIWTPRPQVTPPASARATTGATTPARTSPAPSPAAVARTMHPQPRAVSSPRPRPAAPAPVRPAPAVDPLEAARRRGLARAARANERYAQRKGVPVPTPTAATPAVTGTPAPRAGASPSDVLARAKARADRVNERYAQRTGAAARRPAA